MTTTIKTYDALATPVCTITKTISDTTGQVSFTVEVDLEGVEPNRTETAVERASGISSINPPTVTASDKNQLIRLAVEACSNALHATEGYTLTGPLLVQISARISFAVCQALRKLGEEV